MMKWISKGIFATLILSGTAFGQTEIKLTAADATVSALFGFSVSVDGNTAIVGAYLDDEGGGASGAAYIFSRNSGGANNWGQVKKLIASDSAEADLFAESVSVDGDTAIVGSRFHDDVASDTGSAYIFSRNSGGTDNWGEVKKLSASDAAANDNFGTSVAVDGDIAIVGARNDDDAGSASGSAYIFSRNQGGADNWGQVKKLTASDAASFDGFGIYVAVHGDTAIVGAHLNDDAGDASGSAYIFSRNQGGADNWGEVKKLTASDGAASDQFGISVSVDGDTAIVGAHLNDDGGDASGSAYIFSRNQGGADNWGEVKKLTASDAATSDQFGFSVSVSGDTAIVGARNDSDAGSQSGSAYSFSRNSGGADNWGEVKKLTASDAAATDQFGAYVSVSADTAIVGAAFDDDAGTNSGSAYIFLNIGAAVFQDGFETGDASLWSLVSP